MQAKGRSTRSPMPRWGKSGKGTGGISWSRAECGKMVAGGGRVTGIRVYKTKNNLKRKRNGGNRKGRDIAERSKETTGMDNEEDITRSAEGDQQPSFKRI